MTSLSDKEYKMFNENGFRTKDVKECMRNIKDKMFRYIKDNHKCLGIGCPHCLNWAVCKAIIEEEAGADLCSEEKGFIKEWAEDDVWDKEEDLK